MKSKGALQKLLALAGIEIGGKNPWDIEVHDERLYGRVLSIGSLGLGEAYMDGWWDCQALDQFFERVLGAGLDAEAKKDIKLAFSLVQAKLWNLQSRSRAFEVGERHYDIGNDIFTGMLDKRLTYTCAYWKDAKTLDEAQEAKLDLVCRKLGLKPGQKVLDIGCGWGSFMKFAAEKYRVQCVGLTVSKEQAELGRELCKGLPIEFRLQDYREVDEKFDHIVSLGMFEHVGPKNYREYMEVASRSLKDGGLFLLHTIGSATLGGGTDAWLDRYIFPNGFIPDMSHIVKAADRIFVIEDWHNIGADYDPTLMAWFANFDRAWPKLEPAYGKRFYRMWKYYVLSCAGAFRARKNQLWQIVLSKDGVRGGYRSVR